MLHVCRPVTNAITLVLNVLPEDDHILACALEAKGDVIVSGDKALLDLGSFDGISILIPRQFIERLSTK